MSFLIEDNVKEAKKERQIIVKQQVKVTAKAIKAKSEETVHFLLLWTALFWYYFFSGLRFLVKGKLPRSWKHLQKKQVAQTIVDLEKYLPARKENKKYGRVVDLDSPKSSVNLLH